MSTTEAVEVMPRAQPSAGEFTVLRWPGQDSVTVCTRTAAGETVEMLVVNASLHLNCLDLMAV